MWENQGGNFRDLMIQLIEPLKTYNNNVLNGRIRVNILFFFVAVFCFESANTFNLLNFKLIFLKRKKSTRKG